MILFCVVPMMQVRIVQDLWPKLSENGNSGLELGLKYKRLINQISQETLSIHAFNTYFYL